MIRKALLQVAVFASLIGADGSAQAQTTGDGASEMSQPSGVRIGGVPPPTFIDEVVPLRGRILPASSGFQCSASGDWASWIAGPGRKSAPGGGKR